jgi:hypothetical protein
MAPKKRPKTPPAPFWPDGKHKSWKTIPDKDRRNILQALQAGLTSEQILRQCYRNVTIGTLAAVKAQFGR